MKKLLFIANALLLTTFLFAAENVKSNEVENEQKETSKEVFFGCCTATITYQGEYFDSAESCGVGPGASYCRDAENKLRGRYPFLFTQAPE